MIGTLLLAAAVSAGGGASAEPSSSGVLCVSRLPGAIEFESEGRGVAWSGYDDSEAARRRRRTTHHTFIVEVDGKRRLRVDQTRGGCVDSLAYRGSHVAVFRRPDGSAAGSARFSFERRGVTELELRYDPLYAAALVEKPQHARRAAAPAVPTAAIPERALGALDQWKGRVTVPEEGLRFTFHAPTGSGYRRATVDVTASAAPVERHAAVRLTVSGPSLFESSGPSPLSCSEANEQRPPFETCTANAGGGWDNGGPKDLLLAIDNLAGAAVTVDVQILVMDPLE
jgi:hypothetical protein